MQESGHHQPYSLTSQSPLSEEIVAIADRTGSLQRQTYTYLPRFGLLPMLPEGPARF